MKPVIYIPEIKKHVRDPGSLSDHTRHYVTSGNGETPIFEPYINSASYAEALSGAVLKCVDVVLIDIDEGEVLIATRDQEPMTGAWVFGGRKRAGESNIESAVTNIKRELGIDINPDDLIDTQKQYDEVWDTRAHTSTKNKDGLPVTGSHLSTVAYMLPTAKATIDLRGHNEEFRKLEWVKIDDILLAEPGTYHPALVDRIIDSLERYTQPSPPKTLNEKIEQTENHLAYLKAQKRLQQKLLTQLGGAARSLLATKGSSSSDVL